MEPNEMSNEELIFKYFYSGCDNACEHATMAVEIQNRLRSIDGMIKRPKVEVVKSVDGYYYASVNRVAQSIHVTEKSAQIAVDSLHFAISRALGMDDAKEGGEG